MSMEIKRRLLMTSRMHRQMADSSIFQLSCRLDKERGSRLSSYTADWGSYDEQSSTTTIIAQSVLRYPINGCNVNLVCNDGVTPQGLNH